MKPGDYGRFRLLNRVQKMKRKNYIFLAVLAVVFAMVNIGGAVQNTPKPIDIAALAAMKDKSEKMIVIDARSTLECMDSKIPGALCFSCEEEKPSTLPSDAAKNIPLIFYGGSVVPASDCKAIAEAAKQGFNDIRILQGGLSAWRKAGRPVVSEKRIPRILSRAVSPKKISAWLKQADSLLLIDIRSVSAYAKDHMDGAVNFPLSSLHVRYADIPLDRTLLVVDEDGTQSFLAASYLARKGFAKVSRLKGGMANYRRGAR